MFYFFLAFFGARPTSTESNQKVLTACPCVRVFSLCSQAMTFPSFSRKSSWWRNARTRTSWLTLGATSGGSPVVVFCTLSPSLRDLWHLSGTAWTRVITESHLRACESVSQAWTGPTGACDGQSPLLSLFWSAVWLISDRKEGSSAHWALQLPAGLTGMKASDVFFFFSLSLSFYAAETSEGRRSLPQRARFGRTKHKEVTVKCLWAAQCALFAPVVFKKTHLGAQKFLLGFILLSWRQNICCLETWFRIHSRARQNPSQRFFLFSFFKLLVQSSARKTS